MEQFVRQAKTGRIYIVNPRHPGTESMLNRKDFIKHNPDEAQIRIKALQRRLKELEETSPQPIDKKISVEAAEIASLEAEIEAKEKKNLDEALKEEGVDIKKEDKTEEELAQEEKKRIINEDPDIKKLEAMTDPKDIIDYIAIEFGKEIKLDNRKSPETYRNEAISLRINRLFEA